MSSAWELWLPACQCPYWIYWLSKNTEAPTCPVSYMVPIPKLQRIHSMLFALPPRKLSLPPPPSHLKEKEMGCVRAQCSMAVILILMVTV